MRCAMRRKAPEGEMNPGKSETGSAGHTATEPRHRGPVRDLFAQVGLHRIQVDGDGRCCGQVALLVQYFTCSLLGETW